MKDLILFVFAISVPAVLSKGFGCDGFLQVPQRIDCHPDPNANEANCRDRNCVWCPLAPGQVGPWCFFPKARGYGCTNGFLEAIQRVDCYPDRNPDPSEAGCQKRNCAWCPLALGQSGAWCYYFGKSAGYGCENGFLAEAQRVDCHPDPNANEANCRQRDCAWCPSKTPGIPWCYYINTAEVAPEALPPLIVYDPPPPPKIIYDPPVNA